MSDVIQNLSRLSPSPMDRDALLVRMAQAAVPRPSPVWKRLCAGLMISQSVMAVAWWHAGRVIPTVVPTETVTESTDTTPKPSMPVEPFSYLAMSHLAEPPRPRVFDDSKPLRTPDAILTPGSLRFHSSH